MGAKYPRNMTVGLLTQNVRGFRTERRAGWFDGWKNQVEGRKVWYMLLQETHVTTTEEATRLAEQWSRCWGRQHDPAQPLSFWSVTPTSACGVAILLHPDAQGRFTHHAELFAGRAFLLESQDCRLLNVYAPNKRGEREEFFDVLRDTVACDERPLWLAGDFNCVLDPPNERVTNGEWSTQVSESAALQRFLQHLHLHDVLATTQHDPNQHKLKHLTYWQGSSGARLDRCYISDGHRTWVQDCEIATPHGQTDHKGVVTWMRDPRAQAIVRPLKPVLYPIHARQPAAMERIIGKELGHTVAAAAARDCDWDTLHEHISSTLLDIKRGERRRARRQRKRADARQCKAIRTLQDLIQYVHDRVARKTQIKRSLSLLERSGNSSQLFRRFLQMDDRRWIPSLQRPPNCELPAGAPVADVMAAAWEDLLSHTHSTVAPERQRLEMDRLFVVPTEYQLNDEDNAALLAKITDDDVREAIKHLGSHKAAGPDRLSNDFYRDWGGMVVPALTKEFNRILEGERMPVSFSEAIIVPLPKAGDPTDAANYRPISLLQTSYKILTKILASRVQKSLTKVINTDQNGFVRGRALANNVNLMRAILEQPASSRSDNAKDNQAVILLDFRKAYDTLDRDYVHHSLRAFGYSEEFAVLVDRLHERTRAQFLVNGELSNEIDIVTGIRQGCPLAPLLFLIAAETLKHMIDQEPRLAGIKVHGTVHDHIHSFSAFVDDSVVFLDRGEMVGALEDVLRDFAAVSGLQVQPHKSHAIVLNANCTDTYLGSFPIVPPGTTVTYLGTEMGLADLDEANWAKRSDGVEKRLGILSKYATGIADRVQVINLACIPSLLFTAQFFTPPRTIQLRLESMWRQFVWNGTVTQEPRRAHKIAHEIMHLPRSMGEIGLRDYRAAMLTQAATSILSWNSRRHDKYWEAQHGLLQRRITTATPKIISTYPSTKAPVRPARLAGGLDLMVLGFQAVNSAIASQYPQPGGLVEAKQVELQQLRFPWRGLQWRTTATGTFQLPASEERAATALQQLVYAQMPAEVRTFWATFPWYDNKWVIDGTGQPLTRSAYPFIRIHTIDELGLVQVTPTKFFFSNPAGEVDKMRRATRVKLAEWLRIMIANSTHCVLSFAGRMFSSAERRERVT